MSPVQFHALGSYDMGGGRRVFPVKLDRETSDFSHLIGQTVLIGAHAYKCIGVERFSHSPPWQKGERIGIMTEPVAQAVAKEAGK